MVRVLSDRNRKILASCSGTLLLIILLLLVSLDSGFEIEPPQKITIREVRMYSLPPPPPPPPMEQNTPSSAMPSLARANVENPIKLDVMDLEVDIDVGGISGFGKGGPGAGGGLGTGGDWGTVGFSELDKIPMVISAPPMAYPEEALDQNILEFEVALHIVIDEEGRTYPIRIVQNPFPSMNEEILEFASAVRFTPPTKLGVPVKSEYIWPLLFKKQ